MHRQSRRKNSASRRRDDCRQHRCASACTCRRTMPRRRRATRCCMSTMARTWKPSAWRRRWSACMRVMRSPGSSWSPSTCLPTGWPAMACSTAARAKPSWRRRNTEQSAPMRRPTQHGSRRRWCLPSTRVIARLRMPTAAPSSAGR